MIAPLCFDLKADAFTFSCTQTNDGRDVERRITRVSLTSRKPVDSFVGAGQEPDGSTLKCYPPHAAWDRLQSALMSAFKGVEQISNWHGSYTVWRTRPAYAMYNTGLRYSASGRSTPWPIICHPQSNRSDGVVFTTMPRCASRHIDSSSASINAQYRDAGYRTA